MLQSSTGITARVDEKHFCVMFLRVLCGLVALFVFCNAQVLGKKWDEADSENPNNWINIDSERNNDVDQPFMYTDGTSGSGSGMTDSDDEDLPQEYGSGSGLGVPPITKTDQPPKVQAGPDVTVKLPLRKATVCGNLTTDDHGIDKYLWIKQTSLDAEMDGVDEMCLRVSNMQVGEYVFTLRVTDTAGKVGTDDVRIRVLALRDPTPCETLRDASKSMLGSYVPRCTDDGRFASQQCRGHESTGSCWCSDLSGAEIPGTSMTPAPDCEKGTNLPSCIFKLVEIMRGKLLGMFRPKCSISGDFEAVQCEGQMCFCVDPKTGVKKAATEVFLPDQPQCEVRRSTPKIPSTVSTPTAKPTLRQTAVAKTTMTPKVEVEELDTVMVTTQRSLTTETGPRREPSSAAHMISQPGILAAIIGGSVVLLLCAILLVMFVVYRMRKKDEGSYALDEPKKMPNYSYQRAPDKEFYA